MWNKEVISDASLENGLVLQAPEDVAEIQAARKKAFEAMDTGAASRHVLFNEGYQAGFNAAVDDYSSDKIDLDLFSDVKTHEDLQDAYVLGFEFGYLKKLAEIFNN